MSDLCPICSTKMTEYHDMIDVYNGQGPTSEHYLNCPNKCYSYEYAYGGTNIHVMIRGQHILFGYSYSDDPATVRAEGDAVNIAIEAAKSALIEDGMKDKKRLDWLKYTTRLQDVYWHIENEGGDVRSGIDRLTSLQGAEDGRSATTAG